MSFRQTEFTPVHPRSIVPSRKELERMGQVVQRLSHIQQPNTHISAEGVLTRPEDSEWVYGRITAYTYKELPPHSWEQVIPDGQGDWVRSDDGIKGDKDSWPAYEGSGRLIPVGTVVKLYRGTGTWMYAEYCCGTKPTTTTTTTTPAPCTGSCLFSWNVSTYRWDLTSSTCSVGCGCFPPQFCGSFSCQSYKSSCFRGGGGSNQKNCLPFTTTTTTTGDPATSTTTTSTTSTTTTTGNPATSTTWAPGCSAYCLWSWVPINGTWNWFKSGGLCGDGAPCFCVPPIQPGVGLCDRKYTECIPTTPPPTTLPPNYSCSGSCNWLATDFGWIFMDGGCYLGNFLGKGDCNYCCCQPPSYSASGVCGIITTSCQAPTTTTTSTTTIEPPGSTTSTTTTAIYGTSTTTGAPGFCGELCYWRGNGSGGWTLYKTNCGASCYCNVVPGRVSENNCDSDVTPCQNFPPSSTTTTTSSTTSTTSTTTTRACLNTCSYVSCGNGIWELWENNCSGNCFCPYPQGTPPPCVPGIPPPIDTYPCNTTTTTTTTTTTIPPCTGVCQVVCQDTGFHVINQSCSPSCDCSSLEGSPCGGGQLGQILLYPCFTTTSTTTTVQAGG